MRFLWAATPLIMLGLGACQALLDFEHPGSRDATTLDAAGAGGDGAAPVDASSSEAHKDALGGPDAGPVDPCRDASILLDDDFKVPPAPPTWQVAMTPGANLTSSNGVVVASVAASPSTTAVAIGPIDAGLGTRRRYVLVARLRVAEIDTGGHEVVVMHLILNQIQREYSAFLTVTANDRRLVRATGGSPPLEAGPPFDGEWHDVAIELADVDRPTAMAKLWVDGRLEMEGDLPVSGVAPALHEPVLRIGASIHALDGGSPTRIEFDSVRVCAE